MGLQVGMGFETQIIHSIDGPQIENKIEQEGQVALNRSPEFCLMLTYNYLLKTGHVPGGTWGRADFGPRGII